MILAAMALTGMIGFVAAAASYAATDLSALPAFVGPAVAVLAGAESKPTDQSDREDLLRFLPNSGNNVYQATGLLRRWPADGPRELWRVKIGDGKSAIAESCGRAYTTTQIDNRQYAVCLDPATGRILWKRLLLPRGNHHVVNGPVSSPFVDGDRLYVFPYDNDQGDVWAPRCPCFCLRTHDGTVIWSEAKAFNCSEGTTPLIVNEVLYVGGGGRENVLAAVNKLTGKLLWKVGEDRDAGYSKVYVTGASLTYQRVGDIPQIIVSVYKNDLLGVHARTGHVLWHWTVRRPTNSGMIPTPVAIGSRLLLTAFQGGAGSSECLDMTVSNGAVVPRLCYEDTRCQCNMFHTPSIYNDMVFGFGKGEKHDAMQCTNFVDGRLLWQKESPDWSRDRQLTIADGLIFAITKKDELVLLEASRSGYKELGRVKPGIELGLPQQPMIADGRLYLRGDDTLVCYQIGDGCGRVLFRKRIGKLLAMPGKCAQRLDARNRSLAGTPSHLVGNAADSLPHDLGRLCKADPEAFVLMRPRLTQPIEEVFARHDEDVALLQVLIEFRRGDAQSRSQSHKKKPFTGVEGPLRAGLTQKLVNRTLGCLALHW